MPPPVTKSLALSRDEVEVTRQDYLTTALPFLIDRTSSVVSWCDRTAVPGGSSGGDQEARAGQGRGVFRHQRVLLDGLVGRGWRRHRTRRVKGQVKIKIVLSCPVSSSGCLCRFPVFRVASGGERAMEGAGFSRRPPAPPPPVSETATSSPIRRESPGYINISCRPIVSATGVC